MFQLCSSGPTLQFHEALLLLPKLITQVDGHELLTAVLQGPHGDLGPHS